MQKLTEGKTARKDHTTPVPFSLVPGFSVVTTNRSAASATTRKP